MHIVEKFREIAELNNWGFDYGTKFYQNLNDFITEADKPEKIYFLCDPVNIQQVFNEETSALEAEIYTGGFLFCVKSKLDQKYLTEKFENNIQPLKDKLKTMVRASLNGCTEYTITRWILTESINTLDTNVDGYIVQFEIKESFI